METTDSGFPIRHPALCLPALTHSRSGAVVADTLQWSSAYRRPRAARVACRFRIRRDLEDHPREILRSPTSVDRSEIIRGQDRAQLGDVGADHGQSVLDPLENPPARTEESVPRRSFSVTTPRSARSTIGAACFASIWPLMTNLSSNARASRPGRGTESRSRRRDRGSNRRSPRNGCVELADIARSTPSNSVSTSHQVLNPPLHSTTKSSASNSSTASTGASAGARICVLRSERNTARCGPDRIPMVSPIESSDQTELSDDVNRCRRSETAEKASPRSSSSTRTSRYGADPRRGGPRDGPGPRP